MVAVALIAAPAAAADLTTLASFSQLGQPATGLLLGADGALYGAANFGGANGKGGVFRYTTAQGLSTLASFDGDVTGWRPSTELENLSDGSIVGGAQGGGVSGGGTIYRVQASGTITALASFGGAPLSNAPESPLGKLAISATTVYGTTFNGGSGTVGSEFVSVGTAYRVDIGAIMRSSTTSAIPLGEVRAD